jgi:SOS response regulatory protein OraA/RecX
MLARRELCAAQVAERLRRRGFDAREVESTVARLREEGAIDDLRTARAHARRLADTAHRGPFRAEREIAALGIAATVARAAVAEAYAEHGVQTALERALARRLPDGSAIEDRVHFGKLYRYLVRQGFEPGMISATLRARGEASAGPDDEAPW